MKLFKPLQVCSFIFGIFPCIEHNNRFRFHWIGMVIKFVSAVLIIIMSKIMWANMHEHFQKGRTTLYTYHVLSIQELYPHMVTTTIIANIVCQLHFIRPGVYRIINDCFFSISCDISGISQYLTAFTVAMSVIIEIALYITIIIQWFSVDEIITWLFLPVSNILCFTTEQFYYILCFITYIRLKKVNQDIKTLVNKARVPRWKYWVSPAAGGHTSIGIPAFSEPDIENIRIVHRSCMMMYRHYNSMFQIPIMMCLLDCSFRTLLTVYGFMFEITIVLWEHKNMIQVFKTFNYAAYSVTRLIRIWYLCRCENFIMNKVQ
ncbi:uncharacterized protein LOC126898266, partial [Daktulosphaira vitifoliae]|uniref:uncharacterized protein LOC126898266 n=1 Tax=Daktulosphaira vitifoliae TaxID=58002 RepID=UPI0021AA9459